MSVPVNGDPTDQKTVEQGQETAGQETAGRVAWSVALPEADAGYLLSTLDGGCVVATPRFVGRVGPDGEPGWLVRTESPWPPGPPVRLPDGRLVREEAGRLTVRRPDSGEVLSAVPAPGASALAVTPDADLIFGTWSRQDGPRLNRVSPAGEARWRRPLDRQVFHPPLVLGRWLLVTDGSQVHGYGLDGERHWTVPHEGRGPLVPLGLRQLLAGSSLVDVQTGAARRFAAQLPVHPPVAAFGSGMGLVAAGPTERDPRTGDVRTVLGLDLEGRVRWTHRTPAQPRDLLVDADGQVFLVSSPSLERWRQYHALNDLSGESGVRCLDPSGRLRWAWRPGAWRPGAWRPGAPLTFAPALLGSGRILVAAPGRLWALAGD
jgi:hypothetical protein